jgi:hypothetical protein
LGKTGQEHRLTLSALAEEYARLTQTYRRSVAQCIRKVQQEHQAACGRRAALQDKPYTQACHQEREACEVQMVRLETLRRQMQAALEVMREEE